VCHLGSAVLAILLLQYACSFSEPAGMVAVLRRGRGLLSPLDAALWKNGSCAVTVSLLGGWGDRAWQTRMNSYHTDGTRSSPDASSTLRQSSGIQVPNLQSHL